MKKIVKILLLFLFFFVPLQCFALSKDYNDLVSPIVGEKVQEGKVQIYFFHQDGCSHCKKEKKILEEFSQKYEDIRIYSFETSKNQQNAQYLRSVKALFEEKSSGVPFTVIGTETFLGYNEYIGNKMEETIQKYFELEDMQTISEEATISLPFIGKVNVKEASVPFLAMVLGIVDGFNPCAMWILLLLINMFMGMKNKKKMFLFGYTFLFTSALVYFFSMLGISFILNMTTVRWIQALIGVVALVAGVINIRTFIKTRQDSGCHIVDDKKRKRIFKKLNQIMKQENVFAAVVGVIALAVSVNIVELACSLGFPAIFSEILALNNIGGALRIFYLLIYVLCYMLDDFIVFTIAVCTLSITTKSTKYTKYVNLIAGIIMMLIGILLLVKPEWVMFNF